MAFDDDWRIDRLALSNFRCFEEFALDFTMPVTALVGKNGSGKTAVLDGLAIALSTVVKEFGGPGQGLAARDARVWANDLTSRDAVATLEPVYPVKVAASAHLAGNEFVLQRVRETERAGTTRGTKEMRSFVRSLAQQASSEGSPSRRLPVLAYYGVDRLMGGKRVDGYPKSTRFSAYASALNPKSDLTRLSGFLEVLSAQITNAVAFGDPPPRAAVAQFESIEVACEVVLASTGWGRPRWNPVARELTFTHRSGQTLPLSWLASGIKIAAGLAIDLASRMARANPHLGGWDLLASTPGIVMIDEVDLHLHPSWQQLIVPSLVDAFPRVQFLITTHSPQVLSTIDGDCIRILHDAGVRVPQHSAGLRSDVILRNIQGTKPEPDTPERRELDRYIALVYSGEGESKAARDLRRHIEDSLGGVANNPELADADAHMAVADLGI